MSNAIPSLSGRLWLHTFLCPAFVLARCSFPDRPGCHRSTPNAASNMSSARTGASAQPSQYLGNGVYNAIEGKEPVSIHPSMYPKKVASWSHFQSCCFIHFCPPSLFPIEQELAPKFPNITPDIPNPYVVTPVGAVLLSWFARYVLYRISRR